jgi:4-amino-4-deoxy-L-arabinose transferase-like glycosyltransferase
MTAPVTADMHRARGEPSAAAVAGARRDAASVPIVLALAFALRWILAARGEVIFNDGPQFVAIARAFHAGEIDRALSHVYHPLYSWLAANAYPLFGDYERAALAISITAGTLVGLPLWALLRRLFGRRVAWAGLVLWAAHPFAAGYSANVQSDPVYLLFFVTAVWALWRGLETLPAPRGAAFATAAGACSGLAYLTRPEGVGVLLLGGLWLVLGIVVAARRRLARELPARVLAIALLAGGFVLPSLPYLRHIHETTGEWQLTRKKSLSNLAGVSGYGHAPRDVVKDEVSRRYGRPPLHRDTWFERYVLRGARLFVTFGEALTWPLAIFLALGLAVRGRALLRTRGDLFLLSFFALYGFTLYRLAVTLGYAGRRHMFPLVLLALGWTALGAVTFARRVETALLARGVAWAGRAGAIVLAALVLTMLPKTLRTNANEPIGEKHAGLWIRAHAGPGPERPIVFAPRERILYYADARLLRVPRRFNYDATVAYVRRYGGDFIVTSDSMTDREYPGFMRRIRPDDLRLEARFPERPGSADRYAIYRVLYPEGRAGVRPRLPHMEPWR